MDIPPDVSRPLDWNLSPHGAAQLARGVEARHVATGGPRHEMGSVSIAAGLDSRGEIEARLAERQLAAVIAGLPPDIRPAVPDLSAYDRLLARRPRQA